MNGASARYDFLDWLRVLAIFVLLFFHTGMLFVGWGWHIENAQVIPELVRPMDIAHRLRMPLLFVIAGAGMWYALQRRTGMQLLQERSVRLLLPLVVGMFLIVPPQVFIERLFRAQWHGGYLDFYVQRVLAFKPYPEGDFSWHHLWFIAYLYVYVVIALPLLLVWLRKRPSLRPGLWLALLAVPLGLNEAILKPLFPESHNLTSDWYIFLHYLLLTLYGYWLASMPGAWDWLMRYRARAMLSAFFILFAGLLAFDQGWLSRDTAADAFLANAFTWTALLAFLGYGRRYLSFENRWIRWAREASYPVYILHQTVILLVAYFVVQQPWGAWSKYAVVLTATLVICVLLYQLLIVRWPLARLMFGLKHAGPLEKEHHRGPEVTKKGLVA